MGTHLDRDELERLRDAKRCRTCWRLNSSETVEYEFQAFEPPRYAYVRFECAPANDLSFEARALWPPTVSDSHATEVELAVAEGVADVLLEVFISIPAAGLYLRTFGTTRLRAP